MFKDYQFFLSVLNLLYVSLIYCGILFPWPKSLCVLVVPDTGTTLMGWEHTSQAIEKSGCMGPFRRVHCIPIGPSWPSWPSCKRGAVPRSRHSAC